MIHKTRIINVTRKPRQCPVCGSSVVDIIYGTGDLETYELFRQYRIEGMVGGNNIPKNPPIWECSCGCKRFRKVNLDGSIAAVKLKLLKNVRKRPISIICFETNLDELLAANRHDLIHEYILNVETEFGEEEEFDIKAPCEDDAIRCARSLVASGSWGFQGEECVSIDIKEILR